MAFVPVKDLCIMAIGIALLVLWLIVYTSNKKYASIFESLDESEFKLKDLYFMGYGILEKINYDYKSKKNRELKKKLSVLYEEKYAEFYIRAVRSQQVTLTFTLLIIAFVIYGFSGEIAALVLFLVLAVLLGYYVGKAPDRKIEQRSDELMNEFSEVVSKLALLTDAGMILREAWEEIAFSDEGTIYSEMQLAVDDMNNGVSDIEAVRRFGNRCMLPEIKKFTSTLIQGMSKGNRELSVVLTKQSSEVWDLKRQLVKRKGETAQSKLLIPMVLMFIGILIMVIVPIFSNLGM